MKLLFHTKNMHADVRNKVLHMFRFYCFRHELHFYFYGEKRFLTGGPPGTSKNSGEIIKSDKSAGITGSCFLPLLPSMLLISCGVASP